MQVPKGHASLGSVQSARHRHSDFLLSHQTRSGGRLSNLPGRESRDRPRGRSLPARRRSPRAWWSARAARSSRRRNEASSNFCLLNHPLDCPICDRAGECPLQDQTFSYGPGTSRYIEPKRHHVKPIALGPTIALDRERCVLCWRCVRFCAEVAEDKSIVLLDRGDHTMVGTFQEKPYVSNFSGNVIELCPVGALTGRKQRFNFPTLGAPEPAERLSALSHGMQHQRLGAQERRGHSLPLA